MPSLDEDLLLWSTEYGVVGVSKEVKREGSLAGVT